MWAKFRASLIQDDCKKRTIKEAHKISLNVNEEYLSAVRTKSYTDFFVKVQLLVNEPSIASPTSSYCNPGLSEVLLDPGQETIASLLESFFSLSSNKSLSSAHDHLKALLSNYFDISAEASSFCSQLLKSLNKVQADYTFIHQIINAVDDHGDNCYSSEQMECIVSELRSCAILENPLSKQDFQKIHEKHSSILQHLKSRKKRVARKIKVIRCFNKASGVCATAAFGLVAAAAMFLAFHTLTALLMGPAILTIPVRTLRKKIRSIRFLRYGFLRKVGEQLDVAEKGAYILNRDFDTMSRLVARLQDEIEHNKAMFRFCFERGWEDRRLCFQVLKEIKKSEFGFRKQVEELEEHVYLCLVTINRARALVVKEISKACVVNSMK